MNTELTIPDGAQILAAGGKGGTGNVLLLFDAATNPRVLKMYRTRRSAFREHLRTFSQCVFEGKTGSRAKDRFNTERLAQQVWEKYGQGVIQVLEEPVPDSITDPALWLEYLPYPNLQDVLQDESTTDERRVALLRTLGQSVGEREVLAVQEKEPLLIHEHATLNHFFVHEDQLVAFDLENGYRDTFDVREAVVQELSTLLRSIDRLDPAKSSEYLSAFSTGYEDKSFLRDMLEYGAHGGGFRRRAKRWYDQKSRPGKSKTAVLGRVLNLLQNHEIGVKTW